MGEKSFLAIFLVIFLIYGFTLLYPLLWALINAGKTGLDYFESSFDIPSYYLFKNFLDAFINIEHNGTRFLGMLWNAVVIIYYTMLYRKCKGKEFDYKKFENYFVEGMKQKVLTDLEIKKRVLEYVVNDDLLTSQIGCAFRNLTWFLTRNDYCNEENIEDLESFFKVKEE